jgi:hypothetical protein
MRSTKPGTLKSIGYLVSSLSVVLLGVGAYPGAAKAGLTLALFAGMAASLLGMGLRWLSYEIEERQKSPPSEPRRTPGEQTPKAQA